MKQTALLLVAVILLNGPVYAQTVASDTASTAELSAEVQALRVQNEMLQDHNEQIVSIMWRAITAIVGVLTVLSALIAIGGYQYLNREKETLETQLQQHITDKVETARQGLKEQAKGYRQGMSEEVRSKLEDGRKAMEKEIEQLEESLSTLIERKVSRADREIQKMKMEDQIRRARQRIENDEYGNLNVEVGMLADAGHTALKVKDSWRIEYILDDLQTALREAMSINPRVASNVNELLDEVAEDYPTDVEIMRELVKENRTKESSST